MKISLQKFIGLGVFLFFVLGCSAISKIQQEIGKAKSPQVLAATDGSCQITVPGNWRRETVLNSEATLQASNRLGEQYIVIIRESKQDFGANANLDFLTKVILDSVRENVKTPVVSETTSASVGGFPSKQFEVSGEVENIKIKYLYSITETPQNYYQIITWSLASRFNESRPKLLEVINSFKETGANGQSPISGAEANGKGNKF